MTIDRRTFLLGTARLATVPALAGLLSTLSYAQAQSSLPPETTPADAADANGLAFRIAGWSPQDDVAADDASMASTGSESRDPAREQVWITVNQSWRTAWR